MTVDMEKWKLPFKVFFWIKQPTTATKWYFYDVMSIDSIDTVVKRIKPVHVILLLILPLKLKKKMNTDSNGNFVK